MATRRWAASGVTVGSGPGPTLAARATVLVDRTTSRLTSTARHAGLMRTAGTLQTQRSTRALGLGPRAHRQDSTRPYHPPATPQAAGRHAAGGRYDPTQAAAAWADMIDWFVRYLRVRE